MKSIRLLHACLVTAALAPLGCRAAPTSPAHPGAPAAPSIAMNPAADLDAPPPSPTSHPDVGALIAGESVEGRPIRYSVHGAGADTVLLLATIHGNEDAGTPLLTRLAAYLEQHPAWTATTRVVIVPTLNPDGLAAGRRHNAHGVDLNRNFPAANRRERSTSGAAPLSEPESAALHELIERYRPQRIVSIHGWVGLVDWDGPAQGLAQAVGELCGLPARQIGSRPGSLGSFAGVDRNTPILTLEMPSSARSMDAEELWETYGDALLEFIRWTPAQSS